MQLHAAQVGPDPRRQFLGDDRLGHVVVGARLQARDQIMRVRLGGDDDDRHEAVGANAAAHLETRHVGQAEIEQHQLRFRGGERFEARAAVGRLVDHVPFVLEREAQGEPDLVVVLDEQQRVHSATSLAERNTGAATTGGDPPGE